MKVGISKRPDLGTDATRKASFQFGGYVLRETNKSLIAVKKSIRLVKTFVYIRFLHEVAKHKQILGNVVWAIFS